MKDRLKFAALAGLTAMAFAAIPGSARASMFGSVGMTGDCTGIEPVVAGVPPASLDWLFMCDGSLVVTGTGDFAPLVKPGVDLGTVSMARTAWHTPASGVVVATYALDSGLKLDLGMLNGHELYADFDSGLTADYTCTNTGGTPPLVTTSLNSAGVSGQFEWNGHYVNFYLGGLGGSHSGDQETFNGTLNTPPVPEPVSLLLGAACLSLAVVRRRRR